MKEKPTLKPSEVISDFLNYVDFAYREYKSAYDNVNNEDKSLQDYVHAIEFSKDKAERNRQATALQRSRKYRRTEKDKALLYEELIKFFDDNSNRATLNRMRQLLGKQRKEEEYIFGSRTYKKRGGGNNG